MKAVVLYGPADVRLADFPEKEMGEHGRILIRPSGTEPLIRVMTEGDDPEIAERICKDLSQRIEKRLKELK